MAGLLVLQDEATPLGLQINWTKTKIQQVGEPHLAQPTVQVAAENVDLVNDIVYLGSLISHDGGSETDIATHRNRKGLLLPPREEYLEVSYTYGDEGAALQDLHTSSPALWM